MRYNHSQNGLPYLEGKVIALDTEATGLDPYHGDRVFCWAYFTSKGEWGLMYKSPENLKWLNNLLNDPTKHIVFQEAKFDLKMLSFEGIDVFNLKADIHDTLILSKVLDSVEYRHNLKYLSTKYLHQSTVDKDEIAIWLKSNKRNFVKEHGRVPNFSDAPAELIKRRAVWDVKATLKIFGILYPKAQKICPELYETERKLLFVCLDMENTGVKIDITRAKQLRTQAQKDLVRIGKRLNELICPLTIQKKRKGQLVKETVEEFNPNSNAVHLPAAFTKLGIPLVYKTTPKKSKKGKKGSKGGNWCFDEYAMLRYVSKPLAFIIYESSKENWSASKFYREVYRVVRKHRLNKRELLPPLILKYAQLNKLISTYYNHLIEDCVDVYTTPAGKEVGTLHCKFNQSEAMTGRFSSSGPNLQNMPRLLGPRECFITRKGRKFWLADYEQVEMRFYSHFAKDKKMAARLPTDLHRQTASDMYKKPRDEITKEERERAGTVNFMVIYGAGADKAAQTLSRKGSPTTRNEALRFINRYHSIYPSVRQTSRKLAHQLTRQGYITNTFGRRYYIPIKFSYKALNYMCQGTSADLIKKAMLDTWLWLRKEGLKTKLLMTIHDELVFEIPHCEEKRVIPKLVSLMEDLDTYFVPITIGMDVARNRWSEKEKFKLSKSA